MQSNTKAPTRRNLMQTGLMSGLGAAAAATGSAKAATSGINALAQIAQLKAENANEEALRSAETARKLAAEQAALRQRLREKESGRSSADDLVEELTAHQKTLAELLDTIKELQINIADNCK